MQKNYLLAICVMYEFLFTESITLYTSFCWFLATGIKLCPLGTHFLMFPAPEGEGLVAKGLFLSKVSNWGAIAWSKQAQ
jgi:hypothetical protein